MDAVGYTPEVYMSLDTLRKVLKPRVVKVHIGLFKSLGEKY
jgi:hypothetical protein